MAVEANALGDYLRARRQQMRSEDVGLIPGARRRVESLRREELAMFRYRAEPGNNSARALKKRRSQEVC